MMQSPIATCVLFAAGFDWLEALLPFLFVAFWIVSQVFAVFRRLQGGGRQQPPPPLPRFDPARDRPRPPQPAAEDAADSRSVLEKQIAEFLREATGEKKPQPPINQPPINQPTMQKSEPGAATRPRPPRPERRADADRRAPQAPRAAAPVRREPKKNAVAREDSARITETGSQQPQPQSESVARHVQDAFSRELTHLRGTITQDEPQAGGASRTSASTPAEELMHLLRNPVTVRQVILLREILDRPVDRW
jgi:hypothetical protein